MSERSQGWPDRFSLLPGVEVFRSIARIATLRAFVPERPYLPEHRPRGAEEMLADVQDQQLSLYELWKADGHSSVAAEVLHQANLSGFGHDPEEGGRWTDQGTY